MRCSPSTKRAFSAGYSSAALATAASRKSVIDTSTPRSAARRSTVSSVASTSTRRFSVTCGASRADAVIRSATDRRRPVSSRTSRIVGPSSVVAGDPFAASPVSPVRTASITSRSMTAPSGPEPAMASRSLAPTPASVAYALARGETSESSS
jgi:hypothetical protein